MVSPVTPDYGGVKKENALSGLRIGCVRYLNSRPLIEGLSEVRLEHPSILASALRAGELDAALVPVFEVLRAPKGFYRLVDGVGICSDGPVYSVFVAHEAEVGELDEIVADPASLTSVHLLQILGRKVCGRIFRIVAEKDASEAQLRAARLLIGNQAIRYRLESESRRPAAQFWDLGEAWSRWTGLPFVYAVWVLRGGIDLEVSHAAADEFRAAAGIGVGRRDQIANQSSEFSSEFAARYLSENIRFHIGGAQKRGLAFFEAELASAGFVPNRDAELEWI